MSIISLLIIASLLMAGCGLGNFFTSEPEVPLELDYNRVLPEGWRPIERWHEVNIDGDADTEYLLLFTYDAGQVGAVIYDQQVSTDLVGSTVPTPDSDVEGEGGPVLPLQAFGYYRPYLLLPSNWDYTYGGAVSHGFIAQPQDAGNVVVSRVVRSENNLANVLGLDDGGDDNVVHPGAELVIQGGTTHLTFVWWKNRQEGYGVTQLYAPGGFRGITWPSWRDNPQPIDRISGLYPLSDYRARSLLCRETAFQRVGFDPAPDEINQNEINRETNRETNGETNRETNGSANEGTSGQDTGTGTIIDPAAIGGAGDNGADDETGDIEGRSADGPPVLPENNGELTPDSAPASSPQSPVPSIAFSSRDLGIRFCTPSIPPHPFYPEGVTLAYLLHALESPESEGGNAGQDPARERLVTVGVGTGLLDDILNVETLAQARVNDIQSFATVPVSANAVQNGVFSPTTSVCVELAQLDNPAQRRWLLFTLRYHAPDMEARTADRWTVSGISEQPPPIDSAGADRAGADRADVSDAPYCRVILGLERSTPGNVSGATQDTR